MLSIKAIIVFLCFVVNSNVFAHGFGKDTVVTFVDDRKQSIDGICKNLLINKIYPVVLTYDLMNQRCTGRRIRSVGFGKTNCYFKIGFNEQGQAADIICTPGQQFYMPSLDEWHCAYQLRVGDVLLSKNNILKSITYLEFITDPLDVYMLEVKGKHNFFVGSYSILTHNSILPVHFFAGLTVPFGSVAGGSIGSFLGPVAFAGGVLMGGLVGVMVKIFLDDKIPSYKVPTYNIRYINDYRKSSLYSDDKINDAQAPGIPTVEDGYKAPKNWDRKKVKNPNGIGWGWPDSKGSVWITTGPNGHGGPHWDVQDPKTGRHRNIMPGGKER